MSRCELTAKGPRRPQGEPLEHQDQAAVPANLCNVTFISDSWEERAPARLHQRDQKRRPQWRPRRIPDQGPARSLAPRAGIEAQIEKKRPQRAEQKAS